MTSDQVILDAIKHYHIEFEANTPVQPYPPKQIHFSPGEREIITEEISKLLSKGVLEKTEYAEGDISTIFVPPKKDGSYRMILNLKTLEFVSYYHFKIDTIQTALKLMRPGCFMASVDPQEHTILLSRERVNKGTKRMNSLRLPPYLISSILRDFTGKTTAYKSCVTL